ncbi:glycosyltransferase family 2 protein [Mucilaginibacter sp. AW1-3]
MIPVSVVIITKNEAEIIAATLAMARLITNDIVVIDNGSTDGTLDIAAAYGCRVYQKQWDGYGANKNKGIELAQHDWILSLDADEVADEELIRSIKRLKLDNPEIVYDIRFRSYFGKKLIRFGKWGRDHHVRLFNRNMVRWIESPVHETLVPPNRVRVKKLSGHLHHYSVNNNTECRNKALHYAKLSAQSCYNNNKRATFTKLYLSPVFNFVKNYIVYLGFLDGREGWYIARSAIKHTRLKYYFLKKMEQGNSLKPYTQPNLTYTYSAEVS